MPAPLGLRVWWLRLDEMPDAAALATLSADEIARGARFAFEGLRRRHLASHVALRAILAQQTGLPAAALVFGTGPFGKPFLQAPAACVFNMSHSDDVAVIAVAPDAPAGTEIGVDVEVLRPMRDAIALAERNFTAAEQHELLATPTDQRDLAFMRGWTRKEACLKAIGSGLSIPPEAVDAGLAPERRCLTVTHEAVHCALHVQSLADHHATVIAVATT
ncbi:4'-phosphopantetheinyl transferase family protein [Rhizobacter sp. P5_C2]